MKLILIILSFIAITFGQVPPGLIPPEKPPKPVYLRYNCTVVSQQFNSTIDFLMTDCSCGCSSQYFICSPSIVNNYCCLVTNCKKERFQRCFRQQVECNSIWLSIELQPIGYPDVPKNLTLKKEYYNNCACGDQGCSNKISRYKNRDHIECWTDGTNILLELDSEDESGGSSLSGWAITGIVLGCVLCVYGSWICIKIEQQQHSINQHRINNPQTEKKEPEKKSYLYREPHGYPSNIIVIPPNMNDQPRIIDVQDPPSYHCPDKHECPDPPAYEEGQPSVPECDSGGGEGNSD